jgi:hypothetical protein
LSVEAIAIALHHSKAKGTAKLILLGIANHDGDGGAWPSKATLGHYANVDQRNVDRAIAKLVALREIKVGVSAGGRSNTPDYLRPNLYHFLIECPPYCDRSRQHRDTRKGARYVPRYLEIGVDITPPGASAPGGEDATPPPAETPGDPPALAPPEPLREPATNRSSSYDPNASARAGSKANEEHAARALSASSRLASQCASRGHEPLDSGYCGRCGDRVPESTTSKEVSHAISS